MMTEHEFVVWLEGFFEREAPELSADEVRLIRQRLGTVERKIAARVEPFQAVPLGKGAAGQSVTQDSWIPAGPLWQGFSG